MSRRATIAASQKPILLIQGFLGLLKKISSNAIAVKTAVYLLSPAKPSNTPVISQSAMPK